MSTVGFELRLRRGLGAVSRLSLCVTLCTLVLATGCTERNKAYCTSDGECSSGTCDMDRHACVGGDADAGADDAGVPDAATCGGNDDCMTQQAPVCDDSSGQCRGCDGTGITAECTAISATTPYCAGDGRCAECAGTEGCTGDAFAPVCDSTQLTCRACEGSGEVTECMEIDSQRPRCAPDGRCVQCESHDDCSSTVCNVASGSCVSPANIMYVGGTNASNTIGCGSSGSPCLTVTYGLSQRISQTHIRLRPGNYFENLDIDTVTLTFVGPAAELVSSASSTPVINVNNGADVTIDGLTIRGATGQSGIDCTGSVSKLTLMGGTIVSANQGYGVDATDCEVRITNSAIKGNNSVGLVMNGGDLELRRSEVSANQGGGVFVDKAVFTIVNNFIVDNGKGGGSGSDLAGVLINNIGFTATETMMFNTIADNRARDGSTSFGVSCNVSGSSTTRITSNIVYNPGTETVVTGNCQWRNSLFRGATDMDNITGDPRFVSGSNFRLQSNSPCRNEGETVDEVSVDFYGNPRPQDGGHDMGAHELQP